MLWFRDFLHVSPCRRKTRGPERLFSGIQRQRHHREHGDSRRAGRLRADAGLRSHRRQRRQQRRHGGSRRRARAHVSAASGSSITRRIAGTAARCRPGIRSATKELIFYTDGDAQYDPAELSLLWSHLTPEADIVNGYKISRSDPLHRIVIGRLYHHIVCRDVRPEDARRGLRFPADAALDVRTRSTWRRRAASSASR